MHLWRITLFISTNSGLAIILKTGLSHVVLLHVSEMKEVGVLLFAGGLEEEIESAFGFNESGEPVGPITVTGEFIGGLTIIRAGSDEEAKQWGAKVAQACGWPQEVRRFKE
jgi:hypothetical protein